jgi:hypothetical protein
MALLEFARRRTGAVGRSPTPSLPNGAAGLGRQQSRMEAAAEVGRTLLILMLVALSIVALRYALVLAHRLLQ